MLACGDGPASTSTRSEQRRLSFRRGARLRRRCEALASQASGGIASVEAFKRSLGAESIDFNLHVEVRGTLREGLRRVREFGRWVHAVARGTRGQGAVPPGGAGLGGVA